MTFSFHRPALLRSPERGWGAGVGVGWLFFTEPEDDAASDMVREVDVGWDNKSASRRHSPFMHAQHHHRYLQR